MCLLIGSCCYSLSLKRRLREKIFQTKRITSTAGNNLVYPERHGLPRNTITVDIPVSPDKTGGRLTGWWMVPNKYTVRRPLRSGELRPDMLTQGYTVLYLHGISNSRAYYHRLGLYKVFLGNIRYIPLNFDHVST